MEQINQLKRLLTVSSLNLKTFNGYYLNSIQLIAISGFLSLLLCIFVQTLSPIYLIFGLVLPIFLQKHGVKTKYYWECFAILMVFRRFVVWMAFLDIIVITSLWNPNIDLGKKIFELFQKKDLPTKK